MAIEFRCEKCGKLLSVEAQAGAVVRCDSCRRRVGVPSALASLPVPRIGDEAVASVSRGEQAVLHCGDGLAAMGVLARIMPWVISVFLHAGLALIMMFVAMMVVVRSREDIHVPGEVFDVRTPAVVESATRSDLRTRRMRVRSTRHGGESSKSHAIPSDSGKTDKPVLLIGSGASGAIGGPQPIPWGTGGGGRLFREPPRRGNVHHIVYVIDRSGSMVEEFDAVRTEMLKSISYLTARQDFHVILFSSGRPLEAAAGRLVPARRLHKESAAEFLEGVRARDRTDPIPALRRAFEVLDRADTRGGRTGKLIFLLTDGNFPDNAAVLAAVRRLNGNKTVLVNTYLYGRRPPEAEKVMKQIAEECHGRYKYVSPDESE